MSRFAKKIILLIFILNPLLLSIPAEAQEVHNDYRGTYRAEVLEIRNEEERDIPGTETKHLYQEILIEILSGPQKGEEFVIENDYLTLDEGDRFFFNYNISINGEETYIVTSIDRRASLVWLAIFFVLAIIALGGKQGVRSLLALLGSFVAIFYILMPGLLEGWNPVATSILVSASILFVAVFFTHGFNKESLVAYSGTIIAVLITGLFAYFSIYTADLSGFGTEEAVYLNFDTRGSLDFAGLLLGAMIIGILGVLDDIAITQAAVVTELYRSNPDLTRKEVYKKALRVGREHVSALVNTLVLAYTGASLPLLLYFYQSPAGFSASANSELFATEIVRAIVGSIGLILTVPIVTLLAVIYLKEYASNTVESEKEKSHSH